MVTGPGTLLAGVDGTVVIMEGPTVKEVGLQSEVLTFVERDKFLARFLKKSLSRLATLGSNEKPIRQTYTQFIRQATKTVAAFIQQLARIETVQQDSEAALADSLQQAQAILDVLKGSQCDAPADL